MNKKDQQNDLWVTSWKDMQAIGKVFVIQKRTVWKFERKWPMNVWDCVSVTSVKRYIECLYAYLPMSLQTFLADTNRTCKSTNDSWSHKTIRIGQRWGRDHFWKFNCLHEHSRCLSLQQESLFQVWFLLGNHNHQANPHVHQQHIVLAFDLIKAGATQTVTVTSLIKQYAAGERVDLLDEESLISPSNFYCTRRFDLETRAFFG